MWGPIIGAAISAGGSLLGGMMGSAGQGQTNAQQMAFAQQQQNSAQAFNAQESQKNRDWQQEMSSSAYQRSMADMRAAGLNPILAAGNGGASTPGGSAGSISPTSASLGNPGAAMQAGVSSAGQAGALAMQLKQVHELTKKDQSQTSLNAETEKATKANEALTQELNTKAKQDTATSAAQMHGINTTAANTQADTVNKGIQSLILSHDATTAFQKSRLAKAEADQSEGHGPGTWGNLSGTAEKLVGRTIDYFRSGQSQHDADMRRHRRGGEPNPFPNGNPGDNPGLTIEMTRPSNSRR